jgi:hypothetical protein
VRLELPSRVAARVIGRSGGLRLCGRKDGLVSFGLAHEGQAVLAADVARREVLTCRPDEGSRWARCSSDGRRRRRGDTGYPLGPIPVRSAPRGRCEERSPDGLMMRRHRVWTSLDRGKTTARLRNEHEVERSGSRGRQRSRSAS